MPYRFKTQYLDSAVEVKQWLSYTVHRMSIFIVWSVAVVPAIAVAEFKIPLPIVLLIGIAGFVFLSWLWFFLEPVPKDSVQDIGKSIDFGMELPNREDNSNTENPLDQQISEISERTHVVLTDEERVALLREFVEVDRE
jgi:hypothetical protein